MDFETKFIKVYGTGSLRVSPDTVEVEFGVSTKGNTYKEMQQLSDRNMKMMQQIAEKAGFQAKEVRTVDYSIRSNYERVKDTHGE